MNLAIHHPLVFLGLCGVLICNSVILWRVAGRYQEQQKLGELIQFPPQREEM